jgi:hypothetical protein
MAEPEGVYLQDVDSAAPKSADYSLINESIVSYFYSLVKNYAGFLFRFPAEGTTFFE